MQDIFTDTFNHFMAQPNDVVVIILVLSIGIVFISIVYVFLQAPGNLKSNLNVNKQERKIINNTQKKSKIKKVKYTKEFLKRVEGLDLELKENPKK